jgi:enoyl-CoA hydratase/carnithine racemase
LELILNFIDAYTDSNLAVITMQHSSKGNRLNKKNLEDLYQAIYTSIKDPEVRALLLRSNGSRFCLGMDLNYLQDVRKDKKRIEKAIELYTDVLSTIYKSPKPVIALIEGEVKAGGIGLIAACDIVIASENSSFALSEVLLGLIPANVLPYLLCLRIPPQKARYLILTAKKISAREAEILNLVDEVFPQGSLEKGLRSVLKSIFRASPHAIAETKDFTQAILFKEIDSACDLAKTRLLELVKKPEVLEAVKAFNEGHVPAWFAKFRPKKPVAKRERS